MSINFLAAGSNPVIFTLPVVLSLIAVTVGVTTFVLGQGSTLFLRTVGRRGDLRRRLRRLGVGANIAWFEEVLGAVPAFQHKHKLEMPSWAAASSQSTPHTMPPYAALPSSPDDAEGEHENESWDDPPEKLVDVELTESIWVDKFFFLQVIADANDIVCGLSVTTRSRRFSPTFYAPRPPAWRSRAWARLTRRPQGAALARVRLGRTTFAEVTRSGEVPYAAHAVSGVHLTSYHELHCWGNPGHYHDYWATTSGHTALGKHPVELMAAHSHCAELDDVVLAAKNGEDVPAWLTDMRGRHTVETWTVMGMPMSLERWPSYLGPHAHVVRTLS
jgi:hypothetical protein